MGNPASGSLTLAAIRSEKRGPVRDRPGVRAEERPSGRARSSKGDRFLPPVSLRGCSRPNVGSAAIFHISTVIHKEKEAKRNYYYWSLSYVPDCLNSEIIQGAKGFSLQYLFCRPFRALATIVSIRGRRASRLPPATFSGPSGTETQSLDSL